MFPSLDIDPRRNPNARNVKVFSFPKYDEGHIVDAPTLIKMNNPRTPVVRKRGVDVNTIIEGGSVPSVNEVVSELPRHTRNMSLVLGATDPHRTALPDPVENRLAPHALGEAVAQKFFNQHGGVRMMADQLGVTTRLDDAGEEFIGRTGNISEKRIAQYKTAVESQDELAKMMRHPLNRPRPVTRMPFSTGRRPGPISTRFDFSIVPPEQRHAAIGGAMGREGVSPGAAMDLSLLGGRGHNPIGAAERAASLAKAQELKDYAEETDAAEGAAIAAPKKEKGNRKKK